MKKNYLLGTLVAIASFVAGWSLSPTKVETKTIDSSDHITDATLQIAALSDSILSHGNRYNGRDFYEELTVLLNNDYITSVDKEQCIQSWLSIPSYRAICRDGFDGDCGYEFLSGFPREYYDRYVDLMYRAWE